MNFRSRLSPTVIRKERKACLHTGTSTGMSIYLESLDEAFDMLVDVHQGCTTKYTGCCWLTWRRRQLHQLKDHEQARVRKVSSHGG
jgi:hypothetical protein